MSHQNNESANNEVWRRAQALFNREEILEKKDEEKKFEEPVKISVETLLKSENNDSQPSETWKTVQSLYRQKNSQIDDIEYSTSDKDEVTEEILYGLTSEQDEQAYRFDTEPSLSENAGSDSGGGNSGFVNSFTAADAGGDNSRVKKKGIGAKIVAAILAAILCFGAGSLGGYVVVSNYNNNNDSNISLNVDNQTYDIAEAIATKVMPSVVGISTQTEVTYQSWFGMTQKGVSQGVGTGLIVDKSGYILTNSHVVSDGDASTITVDLYDGRECEGTVLWSDSSIDLAIVKIDADNLTVAELGDSDNVNIGAYAVAIGNPMGLAFERSVTQGIISGLNRTITVSDSSTGATTNMEGLIQTDASINSGNSGGPLINNKGQVIGINSAKAQSAEGLGFAIPINTAKPIIEEIKQKGEFKKAYIGIGGTDLDTVISEYQKDDFGAEKGVYIVQIYTSSPAAQAGLTEGDIITALNGDEVEGMTELQSKLFEYRPGDEIELTVIRDKKEMKVKLILTQQES